MKRSEAIKFLIIRTIGNFLVLFMIFGFSATLGPALYYEAAYRIDKWQGVTYKIASSTSNVADAKSNSANPSTTLRASDQRPKTNDQNPLANLFVTSREKVLIPKSTEFSILIPKIGVSENVFANTDPVNQIEYLKVLEKGVAHAKGTNLPGNNGNIYLFAHSTDNFWNVGRYNAVFYLIKELEKGDEIVIFFNGKRYDYAVSDKKITEASDISYLDAKSEEGELLTLQTCWPPGTTWKRLLVFAKLKTNDNGDK